jgi:tetratricopeptide (TPR) repeat protein
MKGRQSWFHFLMVVLIMVAMISLVHAQEMEATKGDGEMMKDEMPVKHIGRMDPAEAKALADTSEDPLAIADAYDRAWLNDEALEVLEATGRDDADVLWRLARSRVNIGENFETDEEAEDLYIQAMEEAERAAELDPDNADANLQVAICAGRVALVRGIFKASGLAKKTYRHAHLAKTQSDSIPVAYYILGSAHMKIMEKPGLIRAAAGLGFADSDSIGFYFEKALNVSHGNMIQCRLEYARHLIEEGDEAKAKELLEGATELPLRDEQDQEHIKDVKELLATL